MENFINGPCYLLVKEIVTFVFTGAGLIIAGMGLATWKKQLKGTKEFDTAYNVHYSVLRLREDITDVRNPTIFPTESRRAIEYSIIKYPEKSKEDIERDAYAYVYEMRWEKLKKSTTEVESHLLAAEVLWGPDILKKVQSLNNKINELYSALRQNFNPELKTKDAIDIHGIIHDKGGRGLDGDLFSQQVEEAVNGITEYLKEKIS